MRIVKKLALATMITAAVAVSGIVAHGAIHSSDTAVLLVAQDNGSDGGGGGEWPPGD